MLKHFNVLVKYLRELYYQMIVMSRVIISNFILKG
nr:MAG TPA: hypothetical protein [Caudoviricetes sp.]DAN82255.1 MAG TPA: hypothetical protein [Caudoviricetes sp.]